MAIDINNSIVPKVMPLYIYVETRTDTKSTSLLLHRANYQLFSYTVFQHRLHHELCIFISHSLHVTLVKMSTGGGSPLLLSPQLKRTTTASLCSHLLLGLHKCSASIDECQWVSFFPHWRIQWHATASYALPCHALFCQTVPLLPYVMWQQHVTEYWWEGSASTAVLAISASDIMGQHNKIGGTIQKINQHIKSWIHSYLNEQYKLPWLLP